MAPDEPQLMALYIAKLRSMYFIKPNAGVKQGFPFSPLIFTIVLDGSFTAKRHNMDN